MKKIRKSMILSIMTILLFNFLFSGISAKAYVVNEYVAFNPQTGGFYGGIMCDYPNNTNEDVENRLTEEGYIFVKESDTLCIYGRLYNDFATKYDGLINYFVATGKLPAWYTEIPWDGKEGANKNILSQKLANNGASTGSGSTIKKHAFSQKIDLKKKKVSIKREIKYPSYNFKKHKGDENKPYLCLDLKKGSKTINANDVTIKNSNNKVAKVIVSKGKLYLMPFKKGTTKVTIKNGSKKTVVTVKFSGYIE